MKINQVIFLLITIIVLSTAVLAGIILYQHQAYVANQNALALDMSRFVAQVFVYFKTPPIGGGAGQNTALVNEKNLAEFMGYTRVINAETKKEYYSIITENGEFRIKDVSSTIVTLTGMGNFSRSGQLPVIQSTINLYTYMVNNTQSTSKGF